MTAQKPVFPHDMSLSHEAKILTIQLCAHQHFNGIFIMLLTTVNENKVK